MQYPKTKKRRSLMEWKKLTECENAQTTWATYFEQNKITQSGIFVALAAFLSFDGQFTEIYLNSDGKVPEGTIPGLTFQPRLEEIFIPTS